MKIDKVLSQVQAIIFDAEGVVINTEPLWDKSQKLMLEARGLTYDRAALKPMMAGRSIIESAQVVIDFHQLKETADHFSKERFRVMSDLLNEEVRFVPGFNDFFKLISSYKTAVATSMDKQLMKIVEGRLPLKSLFNGHIYHVSDAGGKSKPAPDVFLHAANAIGVKPEKCLVIEDSPLGIEGAKNAGMHSVAITTTFEADAFPHADLIIKDFATLAGMLSLSGE